LGRRKLAPVLSPHKTVEGFAGGILAAILAATLFQALASLSTLQAIEYGIALCLIGLTGDLSASWVKRHARIKDYRQAFPGHGGVLDRFDSFIPNCAILGLLSLDPVLSG
jgi:phosphatidate cytidylyltransferase